MTPRLALPVDKTRADWNAQPPKAPRTAPDGYTHLEVHHTGSPDLSSIHGYANYGLVVLGIQRFHQNTKLWNDIFYNGFVDPDGIVWPGRNDTPNGGYRLCFMGNFEHETPTEAQRATLARWIPLFDEPTDWHAQRAAGTKYASACPGRNMIALIAELEDQADRNDRPILIEDGDDMSSLHAQVPLAVDAIDKMYERYAIRRPLARRYPETPEALEYQLNRYFTADDPAAFLVQLGKELASED